ncbi:MAG: AEC family transporter [Candidatus Omnitrophota bacterium]
MNILSAFKITAFAMMQIFILGISGYLLTKKNLISVENLKFLTTLVINLFFPAYVFIKLISNFSFKAYPNWWVFPLLSFFVTVAGFIVAKLFIAMDKNLKEFKRELVSLITFQNGGYLPLILVVLLLPPGIREQMLVYIFLFLLGFNTTMWSIGVFYLTNEKNNKLNLRSLFSPPVIAIISALLVVAVGLNKIIPDFLTGSLKMLGDCALPLAIMTVGANLALINISGKTYLRYIIQIILAKLIFMPILFLGLIFLIRPSYAIALLLLLQSTMPSAVSPSIIMRHYDKKDNIVSLGIFWTHVISLFTIPIFLILFSAFKDFMYR